MNDAEINAIARGLFMYLKEQCEPVDSLAVIICLILIFYELARNPNVSFPIEEYADKLKIDVIHHWKTRNVTAEGTETIQ